MTHTKRDRSQVCAGADSHLVNRKAVNAVTLVVDMRYVGKQAGAL